jgi:hypothetical protein
MLRARYGKYGAGFGALTNTYAPMEASPTFKEKQGVGTVWPRVYCSADFAFGGHS